jgi:hypothetical protein
MGPCHRDVAEEERKVGGLHGPELTLELGHTHHQYLRYTIEHRQRGEGAKLELVERAPQQQEQARYRR